MVHIVYMNYLFLVFYSYFDTISFNRDFLFCGIVQPVIVLDSRDLTVLATADGLGVGLTSNGLGLTIWWFSGSNRDLSCTHEGPGCVCCWF